LAEEKGKFAAGGKDEKVVQKNRAEKVVRKRPKVVHKSKAEKIVQKSRAIQAKFVGL
jgi:hypothetical protein